MKNTYYISGEAIKGEYTESFVKLIVVSCEREAFKKVRNIYKGYSVYVDVSYETLSDAMI